jgi:transcriptional regulator with XRE-family HTH domain
MDAVRLGLTLRALRRRRGWTQADVARRARLSQSTVSRVERGEGAELTSRTLERVAEALEARLSVRVLYAGEAADRLLDAAHAAIVDDVVILLRGLGWDVATEVTFAFFGERGSVDVLALHRASGSLLVVEVKSAVPDLQSMQASLDTKVRLAGRIASQRGWVARTVSRLLILPDDSTSRRRVAQHAATFAVTFPARTSAVRRWLRRPEGALGGLLFLASSRAMTARHRVATRRRAAGPRSSSPSHRTTG